MSMFAYSCLIGRSDGRQKPHGNHCRMIGHGGRSGGKCRCRCAERHGDTEKQPVLLPNVRSTKVVASAANAGGRPEINLPIAREECAASAVAVLALASGG